MRKVAGYDWIVLRNALLEAEEKARARWDEEWDEDFQLLLEEELDSLRVEVLG